MNRRKGDITPDEIFVESSNVSRFNTAQFEGRIEKPISARTFFGVGVVLFIIFAVFSGRMWYLQVFKGEAYAQISENNRLDHIPVFSERGVIFDRNGERLAWNVPHQETSDFSLRQYTDMPGLAHVLGYVTHPAKDTSGFYYQYYFSGKAGVEKAFDQIVTGSNGTKIRETNALGETLSESVIDEPVSGENIHLSIDSRIQSQMFNIIKELAEEVGFYGGAGALMNVETGEMVALTSYPEYDNEAFALGHDAEYISATLNDDSLPLINRTTSGLYTPGSIIKPFMALSALNEGVITPDRQILSTGQLIIPNPYFPDLPSIFTDWKAHGLVDMYDALAMSSNIYFYNIGGGYKDQRGVGIEKIGEYMRQFGFGEETGVEIGNERLGVIPSPDWKLKNFEDGTWRLGDTYNTSIGQYGFQVTPIQAVRAIAAIANSGIVLEPTLMKTDGSTADMVRIVDAPEKYFQDVRRGMRQAVEAGTAQGISVPYVQLAGKTGTAEVGISKQRVNAWVTGFFPYENPKYAFVVMMEEGPRENLIGGVYVMRRLLDWMHINTPEYF